MATDFYLSSTGDDQNTGLSKENAWKTISKLNSINYKPGDNIFLKGGSIFEGNLWLPSNSLGTPSLPITISSFGNEKATIYAGNSFGIYAENTAGICIKNLIVQGSGKTVNTNHGIIFWNTLSDNRKLDYIHIENVEVYGFQKSGIFIGAANGICGFKNIRINNCVAHDNGEAGISTYGPNQYSIEEIQIQNCKAYNNSGRTEITNTHTGNGILLGSAMNGIIEYCEAYNNGFLNNHHGGGPVGIWCYNSDNIIIQYNQSHHNKAGSDADGGGFDIDGGTTNSIIQYNYSHDNEGAGFMLAEYNGAAAFSNNVIRYNISENDGRKNSYGAIALWGGEHFSDCYIYNNTIYTNNEDLTNGTPSCFLLVNTNFSGIKVYNNIFITKGNLPIISSSNPVTISVIQFLGNNYYSYDNNFKILWNENTYSDLTSWKAASLQEKTKTIAMGISEDPLLSDPGNAGTISDRDSLADLIAYKILPGSPMIDAGIDLSKIPYGPYSTVHDFWNTPVPSGSGTDIGACEMIVFPTTSLEDIKPNRNEIIIFPNPVSDKLTLKIKGFEKETFQLTIMDLSGKEVYKGEIVEGKATEMYALDPGLYFALIKKKNSVIETARIVIR